MAFLVEDGTGLSTSTSYVSLAEATAYYDTYGYTTWADYSEAEKEIALNLATKFIDRTYKFIGYKLLSTQALEFPRTGAVTPEGDDVEGIPNVLKEMTYEAAYRALTESLFVDVENPGNIKRQRVYDAVEIEYTDGGASQKKKFPVIDNIAFSSGLVYGKYGSGAQLNVIRA